MLKRMRVKENAEEDGNKYWWNQYYNVCAGHNDPPTWCSEPNYASWSMWCEIHGLKATSSGFRKCSFGVLESSTLFIKWIEGREKTQQYSKLLRSDNLIKCYQNKKKITALIKCNLKKT